MPVALSCRAGILPPGTGAGNHSGTSHLVSVDLQASLPRMGWEGLSGALPILATALLFTHWALGESTLLILVKRYQQQGDTTSEHRRLERGTLSASCGRSRKGRTDPLGVANSLLFPFASHEKGKWYSCRVSDPISGIFHVSVAWSTNQDRCS